MAKGTLRAAAAKCLFEVLEGGQSLSSVLPQYQANFDNPKDKGLLAELCYGVLRNLSGLELVAIELMKKPFSGKKRRLQLLVLVGIYQLMFTRVPDHAAIAETVAAAPKIGGAPFKGVINGVLRNTQRHLDKLKESVLNHSNHPSWLIGMLKKDHPLHWQEILDENQQRPPMWLRVNQQQTTLAAYQSLLTEAGIDFALYPELRHGICLSQAVDVTKLPYFADGYCSVQDGAAQFAAQLLEPQAKDVILDACAAPGGKTCHILESQPEIGGLTALEVDSKRATSISDNLQRLKVNAKVVVGDATEPETWWDGQLFDRILLDAPCSATGVIRRHPDIKWLRRYDDIAQLAQLQQHILETMWHVLKPGGTLLYATCSVLSVENSKQIEAFLIQHDDAIHVPLHADDTQKSPGWQLLPGKNNMDGFFYALIKKRS